MRRIFLALLAGITITLGLGLITSPAFACTGGACQNATITITPTLALSTTATDFTLTNNNVNTAPQGSGVFTVQTNDTSGYQLQVEGPANFGTVATADVSFTGGTGTGNNGGYAMISGALVASTTQMVAEASTASAGGGDNWDSNGFDLNVLPQYNSTPQSGTITWWLVGK